MTIEGDYEAVVGRLDHPQAFGHDDLDAVDDVASTLAAVATTGGGIRSEIYEAVDFELDDPREIRKHLEVLAITT